MVILKPNPKKSHTYFSCCHQSDCLQHMQKVSLLEAYDTIYINMISIVLVKYFTSLVKSDDDSLRISLYKLI